MNFILHLYLSLTTTRAGHSDEQLTHKIPLCLWLRWILLKFKYKVRHQGVPPTQKSSRLHFVEKQIEISGSHRRRKRQIKAMQETANEREASLPNQHP